MKNFFSHLVNYKKLVNIFLITLIVFFLGNILFGEKNLFDFNKNLVKINNLEKEILVTKSFNNEINFLHDQFKNDNRDLQEYFIRKNLNFKAKNEIIIVYD